MHRDDEGARGARFGDLLDDLHVGQERPAETAVFRRERDAEQVVLGEEFLDVPRKLAALVDLGGARCDALGDQLSNDLEDQGLLFGGGDVEGLCDGHQGFFGGLGGFSAAGFPTRVFYRLALI